MNKPFGFRHLTPQGIYALAARHAAQAIGRGDYAFGLALWRDGCDWVATQPPSPSRLHPHPFTKPPEGDL